MFALVLAAFPFFQEVTNAQNLITAAQSLHMAGKHTEACYKLGMAQKYAERIGFTGYGFEDSVPALVEAVNANLKCF